MRPTAISGSADSRMSAKFVRETENNIQASRQVAANKDDIVRRAHPLVRGFGKQTGLVNNLETWANLTGAEISPVC